MPLPQCQESASRNFGAGLLNATLTARLFVFKALFRNRFVSVSLLLVLQGDFHIGQMRLDGGAGAGWVAGLQAVIDGAVLVQKIVACGALFEHHLAIVEHEQSRG